MLRVVVSVRREGEPNERDLEVPAEVESHRLVALVARALGWDVGASDRPVRYNIHATPPGRVLHPYESLADLSIWDGARLVFQRFGGPAGSYAPSYRPSPASSAPPVAPTPPAYSPGVASSPLAPPSASGPIAGWRSLDIDLPESGAEPDEPGETTTGFTWKQLD